MGGLTPHMQTKTKVVHRIADVPFLESPDGANRDSFLVTEYAKSAAGKLKRTEGVGTIVATFQASWVDKKDAPADEPGLRRGGLGGATGFGPPIGGGLREVSRELGVIRDCISVRYAIPK